MKGLLSLFLFAGSALPCLAQQLSLDSCRQLALRNNKQLNIAKMKQDVALNTRKATHTKLLPHVNAVGGYTFFSRKISLLNNEQKAGLSNLGTTAATKTTQGISNTIISLAQQGIITPAQALQLQQMMTTVGPQISGGIAQMGNELGASLRDALDTDTRNVWSGAVMVTQPIYMGGGLLAANRMAKLAEKLASNGVDERRQTTLYDTDQAYWTVVSLRQKEKLATSYLNLVRKLDTDVAKMIREGVATRADGLKVSVKVNEAEMQLTQVDDGLSLARMYLCQLCGLPLDSNITLSDEGKETLPSAEVIPEVTEINNRPELRMLETAVNMSKEATKMVRAAYLPQVGLTGGYLISNPNLFNGFQRKFAGVWNVGIVVRVPVWNWCEGDYKVRASKITSRIATLELSEAKEKIELQVNQSRFKVKEAYKKLAMARKNIERADENLRCANLGFKEGVMETTDVMAAQTAWLQAQTQKIDAEIDVKLSLVNLKKALGVLE